ncbi:MAG: bifunctional 4-hydroxy-2-oxoglutarate aldolase/2-dehydro-3-deoxy-phosphogluconate aldolase [Haloferacaceae archaeon]
MGDIDDFERIRESGVVAVVRGADADLVVDVADALVAGGVTAVEVTADTAGATEMIADVASVFDGDEAIVGAGTVLDAETARAALMAGAEFLVAPNFDEGVVETANRYSAVVAPGVMTPTEAVDAVEAGADLVKVFPASTLGPGHLAAMKGPLSHVPMMPTGGVDVDNAGAFVEAGAVAVGAGSALVDLDAARAGEFEAITETARAFRREIESARARTETRE